ncbi:MAG: COX15/CtaA family protein [Acidimicrobiales bacterium]|jgi:cytochrome c oxidase assembly protein subunit 15
MSMDRFQRRATFALWSLAAIVLAGAAVRLTGSGLGCSDWPTCETDQLVPAGSWHSAVEFGNRMFSAVPAIAVILVVTGARKLTPPRRDLYFLSWGLVIGVIAQIIIGRFVVSSDLLPSTVILHFLVSIVLLANAVVLEVRSSQPADASVVPLVPPVQVWLGRLIVVVAAYVIVTGTIVTGTGPHAGDPDSSNRLGYFLPDVARIHSVGVLVMCGLVVVLAWWAHKTSPKSSYAHQARVLVLIILGQGAIGYLQYFTDVPVLLVAVHILGAVLLWVATLRLYMALFSRTALSRAASSPSTPSPPATEVAS